MVGGGQELRIKFLSLEILFRPHYNRIVMVKFTRKPQKSILWKWFSNIFWVVFFLVLISILFSGITMPGAKPKDISFSELATKIQNEEIKSIIVRDNKLEIVGSKDEKYKSLKESPSSLPEILLSLGVDQDKLTKVNIEVKEQGGFLFWLGILLPIILPFLLVGFIIWYLSRQAQRGAMQIFSFSKANIRLFSSLKDKITFNDVAGLKEAKEELKEVVEFLMNPKKFHDIGAKIPRGVLLMGPPGTGKTLLARAVAGEANVPFFHISGSEFVEMFVGVGASRVRDVFQTSKKAAPAIVFIDEIDAVGRERGAGLGGGHDEREQTLNQILVEMDGFDRDTAVIVIAATNRPDILDRALLRPGRFDRRIILDLPDINDREEILKIHIKNIPLSGDINLRRVAERTPGFSGADLANLINEGAILAARRNKKIVDQTEFLESIEKVILGPERKSRILGVKEKEIAAYHEAGHALVAAFLPGADPVHKISIISRGRAAGYTLKLPIEEKAFRSKTEFFTDLSSALGGYAAEKLIFKDITTGASNDLKEASKLARRLITQYGMSEKLGPITYGDVQELIFLGKEIATEKDYSEAMAQKIDEEVKDLMTKAYKTAYQVLSDKKPLLEKVVARLMEVENIEQEEFYKLIGKSVPRNHN